MQRSTLDKSILCGLILLASFFSLVNIAPTAYATDPTLRQSTTANNCPNGNSCALAFTVATVSGNVLIAYYETCCTTTTVTFSDTQGNSYTAICQKQAGGTVRQACLGFATSGSSAGDTITASMTGGTNQGGVIYTQEVNGITTDGCSALGIGTSTKNFQTSTSCPFTSSPASFLAAITIYSIGVGTPETGYTLYHPASGVDDFYACIPVHGQAIPCGTGSGPVSPTFFKDPGDTTANFVEVGYAFGPTVVVTAPTVVGACNFFQLQCWWYPLLFMMAYAGTLLLVSQWLAVSPRGKAHIFLSAVTFGSLIAVILGIMNIVFPLLMLILNTLIVLRIGGRN